VLIGVRHVKVAGAVHRHAAGEVKPFDTANSIASDSRCGSGKRADGVRLVTRLRFRDDGSGQAPTEERQSDKCWESRSPLAGPYADGGDLCNRLARAGSLKRREGTDRNEATAPSW
jgi:hypothetical protein